MSRMELGPPPAAGMTSQMQGPFSPAAARGQQPQPPQPRQPGQGPGQGSPQDPVEGQMIVATIHMKEMLKQEPALAPWVNQAINLLQTGVRTVLAQQRQQSGTSPMSSATPSSEPGAGLPV